MYRFESLYPCSSVTIEDGLLAIRGIFTERRGEQMPLFLIARVTGAKTRHPIRYEVSLARLAVETQVIWQDSFELVPASVGYRPVELTARVRGGEMLLAGVYVATMALDDGQQASISFDVK